jgi:hypothetical protein
LNRLHFSAKHIKIFQMSTQNDNQGSTRRNSTQGDESTVSDTENTTGYYVANEYNSDDDAVEAEEIIVQLPAEEPEQYVHVQPVLQVLPPVEQEVQQQQQRVQVQVQQQQQRVQVQQQQVQMQQGRRFQVVTFDRVRDAIVSHCYDLHRSGSCIGIGLPLRD